MAIVIRTAWKRLASIPRVRSRPAAASVHAGVTGHVHENPERCRVHLRSRRKHRKRAGNAVLCSRRAHATRRPCRRSAAEAARETASQGMISREAETGRCRPVSSDRSDRRHLGDNGLGKFDRLGHCRMKSSCRDVIRRGSQGSCQARGALRRRRPTGIRKERRSGRCAVTLIACLPAATCPAGSDSGPIPDGSNHTH